MGDGGVSRAVLANLKQWRLIGIEVVVITRSYKFCKNTLEDLGISKYLPYTEVDIEIENSDLIINCTPLGFGDLKNKSILSERQIGMLNKNSRIFDVVYSDQKTPLQIYAEKYKLEYKSGSDMNLEQAAIGFKYATSDKHDKSIKEVLIAMQKALG